jgi:hypothetical protein
MKKISFCILFYLVWIAASSQITDKEMFYLKEFENKYIKNITTQYYGNKKINQDVFFKNDITKMKYQINDIYKDSCVNFKISEIKTDQKFKHTRNDFFSNNKKLKLTVLYSIQCSDYEYSLFEIYNKEDQSGLILLLRKNITTGIIENKIKTFIY